MPGNASGPGPAIPRERGLEWGLRALVVDDDAQARRALARELTRLGMEVTAVESAAEALEEVERLQPPVVVADLRMPGMDGVAFLAEVKRRHPRVQRLLISGDADTDALVRATNEAGVAQVLVKPIDGAVLLSAVRTALEVRRHHEQNDLLQAENVRLEALLDELHDDVRAAVRRREARVADGKALLERVIDALPTPLAVVGGSGVVRAANRVYADLCGVRVQGVIGRRCYELFMDRSSACAGCPLGDAARVKPAEDAPNVELDVPGRGARTWRAHLSPVSFAGLLDPDGTSPTQAAWGWVCAYRDITAERNEQLQAARAERMIAVGELAAGVAHELNNPLGGALALAQVLKRDGELTDDDREIVGDIEDAALRCKRIIEALLTFARAPQTGVVEDIDVATCVEQAVAVAAGALKHARALLDVLVEPDLPAVRGASSLLQQAIVALIRNAAEALLQASDVTAGTITLRALREGGAVWIEVADDGPGLSVGILQNAFTPLVSGRDTAEGAGFGLALVYRVAESFGGHVEIASGEEGGATVRMVIPAVSDSGDRG